MTSKHLAISNFVLSLLETTSVATSEAEFLTQADTDDIEDQYASALDKWELKGRNLWDIFVTENVLFLHFKHLITRQFGLEILSPPEAAQRQALLQRSWSPQLGSC